jgi:ribosome-associated heat shock protein Hsp15
MDGTRIDKWLWAARFFKTRPLAAQACDLGRVQLKGQPIKPAREVRIGDALRITTAAGDFDIKVEALSETRGPAAVALTLYSESDASKGARLKAIEERKLLNAWERLPETKPTGRDRRTLNRLRGRDR